MIPNMIRVKLERSTHSFIDILIKATEGDTDETIQRRAIEQARHLDMWKDEVTKINVIGQEKT